MMTDENVFPRWGEGGGWLKDDKLCFFLGVINFAVICHVDMVDMANIAKGTTDPRVEFISQAITKILIKQFQI